MANFGNLTWDEGTENMGGCQQQVFRASVNDIKTFPSLPASPSTMGEVVTLTGDYVMNTSKKFDEIYVSPNTADVQDDVQGEVDGQSFIHKGSFFHPGTRAEVLGWCAMINNKNNVFVFVESNGQQRVVGSKAFPAKVKPKVSTGKAYTERKGVEVEVTSYGFTPAPIYPGTVPLEPGA